MNPRLSVGTVAVALLVVTGGCRLSSPALRAGRSAGPSAPVRAATVAPAPPASAAPSVPVRAATVAPAPPASAAPSAPVRAAGPGWSTAGLDGPVPAPGTCRYRLAADGYYLPDPACTPGAVDPTVTPADLASTVCRQSGYTSSVRPPESLTERFKMADEAGYQDPFPTSRTELDHLIPLELGGASDTRNLWAEPDQGGPALFDPQDPFGVNAKDGVENRLHQLVCDGRVSLVAAQEAIAADWTTALTRLGATP